MPRVLVLLTLLGLAAASSACRSPAKPDDARRDASGASASSTGATPTAFPTLAQRIPDLALRRTCKNALVRRDLVLRVAQELPHREAETFVREMLSDEDGGVRAAAFNQLAQFGYRVRRDELPRGPGDLAAEHLPTNLEVARAKLESDAPAAVYVSVFGDASDVPPLLVLAQSRSVYLRSAAAYGLAGIGEDARARAILESIAATPARTEAFSHFYVEIALLMLLRSGDKRALADLVALLAELQGSSDPNDEAHYGTVGRLLRNWTGQTLGDASEWREWLARSGDVSTPTWRPATTKVLAASAKNVASRAPLEPSLLPASMCRSPNPSAAPVKLAPSDLILTVGTRGGHCRQGTCSGSVTLRRDGSFTRSGSASTSGRIDVALVDPLALELARADFGALLGRRFKGTCPTAHDGSEVIYTFLLPGESVRMASCEVAIDGTAPLMLRTTAILQAIAATP